MAGEYETWEKANSCFQDSIPDLEFYTLMKPEWTVVNDWAIRHKDGFVKHLVCKRFCDGHNIGLLPNVHMCHGSESEQESGNQLRIRLDIPHFVQLISDTFRKVKQ